METDAKVHTPKHKVQGRVVYLLGGWYVRKLARKGSHTGLFRIKEGNTSQQTLQTLANMGKDMKKRFCVLPFLFRTKEAHEPPDEWFF